VQLVQQALEQLVQSLVAAAAESPLVVGQSSGSPCGGPYNTMPSSLHPTVPLHPLHSCTDRLLAQEDEDEAEDEAEDAAVVVVVAAVGELWVEVLVVVLVVQSVW